jgi:hypothetical protein
MTYALTICRTWIAWRGSTRDDGTSDSCALRPAAVDGSRPLPELGEPVARILEACTASTFARGKSCERSNSNTGSDVMTRTEASRAVAAVRLLWPHSKLGENPASVISMWHSMLGGFPYEDVDAAVRELASQGREFAPPVGTVVKMLTERTTGLPDWDETWAEVEAVKRRYHPAFPGRETPPPDRFSHPLIAAFAVPAWRELCLGPAPGTKDFGTFYAQQREAWKALAARSERSVALAAVGAPRRRGELKRPDYPVTAEAVRALLIGGEAA